MRLRSCVIFAITLLILISPKAVVAQNCSNAVGRCNYICDSICTICGPCNCGSGTYECPSGSNTCCPVGIPAASPTPGGGCSGPCPTTPPPQVAPIGWLDPPDNSGCNVYGWTCDSNHWATALNVEIYADNPKGSGGTLVTTLTANVANEAAVTSSCGGTQPHRFYLTLPSSFQDGTSHRIYAYGLGVNSVGTPDAKNALLLANGNVPNFRTITCPLGTIPNYTGLTANPSSIYLGDSTVVSANFTSPQGNLGGQFITGTNPSNLAPLGSSANTGIAGNSGPLSYTWTPGSAGSTTVYARAWNDSVAECRPAALVDAPPKFACAGPGLSAVVDVTNPTCIGSMVCADAIIRAGGSTTCTATITTTPLVGPAAAVDPAYALWGVTGTAGLTVTQTSMSVDSKTSTATVTAAPGASVGSRTITFNAAMQNGPNTCLGTANLSVQPALSAWFGGGGGGDIIAANGTLNSTVPTPLGAEEKQYFLDQVLGISPSLSGVALGQNLNLASFDQTNVSQVGWMREISNPLWTNILAHPETSYAYMKERILAKAPAAKVISGSSVDLSNGALSIGAPILSGVFILRANGPISISGDTGGLKYLILADGAVTITGNTGAISAANGFFAVLSGSDITVANSVGTAGNTDIKLPGATPQLRGIFYANNIFSTGGGSLQLKVDGIVVGMNSVSLGRTNAGIYPAEYFQFNPDFFLIFSQLGPRHKIVQELLDF